MATAGEPLFNATNDVFARLNTVLVKEDAQAQVAPLAQTGEPKAY